MCEGMSTGGANFKREKVKFINRNETTLEVFSRGGFLVLLCGRQKNKNKNALLTTQQQKPMLETIHELSLRQPTR